MRDDVGNQLGECGSESSTIGGHIFVEGPVEVGAEAESIMLQMPMRMGLEWNLSLFCPAIVPHGDDDLSCTINDFFLNSTHDATRFMPCHQ